MEADVKRFIGFVAPLAILYITWASVTTEVTALAAPALKSINVGQIASAPSLPSAEAELRDPFTPEGAISAALAATAAKGAAPKVEQPLHLDGTVIAGKLRFAVINGTRVTEGDFFRGLKLERVEATRVVLRGGKQETVLPLEVAKSEAIQPLPVSAPDAGATHEPAAAAAATGGMGGTGRPAGGMGKSLPAKKPSANGMGAKPAPRAGGGGMGH